MTEERDRPRAKARMVKGFEGGAVYAAERDGIAYVIEDESGLAWMLDPVEDADILKNLRREIAFPSVEERDAYLRERGWLRGPTA